MWQIFCVWLTRNGETVAVVLSVWEYQQAQPAQPDFWQALQAFRQQWNLAELGLDDDIFSHVRDRTPRREVIW